MLHSQKKWEGKNIFIIEEFKFYKIEDRNINKICYQLNRRTDKRYVVIFGWLVGLVGWFAPAGAGIETRNVAKIQIIFEYNFKPLKCF